MPEDLAAENARLRRENHKLRDTNELLKAASAFSRRNSTHNVRNRFIDEYRNRFSVEFICKTLKDNRAGGFITSRGYRQSKARRLSARRLRDAVLVARISATHRENYGVYGVRKMWHALDRDGIDIGREQTARLMRLAGVSGKSKGGAPITTRKPNVPDLRPDLVEREFNAQDPNTLWGLTRRMCARRKTLCMPRSSPTFTPGGSLGGRYQTRCGPRHCPCKLSTRRSYVLRKQQVSFTIRITDRSTSAWSTTSDLPNTALQLPPELSVTPTTMLLLKTSTDPTRTS